MKILVFNGSPKGDQSVTLQSVRFIEKKFRQHDFDICHISKSIKTIKKDPRFLKDIIEQIAAADVIVWCTPVYVCLVPSQMIEFINILYENHAAVTAIKGKYSAVITTSIHFFDHCAHRYLTSVCHDLGLQSVGEYAADSYDLLNAGEQDRLYRFAAILFDSIILSIPYCRPVAESNPDHLNYIPGRKIRPVSSKGNILIITDATYEKGNTARMVERLKATFTTDVAVLDIGSSDIMKGGCLGCVQCGFDHQCIYEGMDSFIECYNAIVRTADIIIFAATIRHRFFSARVKRFFDRAFFNNHTPTLKGRQVGFVLSGSFLGAPYLQDFIELYAQWQGANLVGIVTDEAADSEQLDQRISCLAKQMDICHSAGYVGPPTFLGVGGMKIFRDDIWGRHRFVFQADHAHFEANGLYDFPQDDHRIVETNAFMFEMTAKEPGRSRIRKTLAREMVRPHKKKLENI